MYAEAITCLIFCSRKLHRRASVACTDVPHCSASAPPPACRARPLAPAPARASSPARAGLGPGPRRARARARRSPPQASPPPPLPPPQSVRSPHRARAGHAACRLPPPSERCAVPVRGRHFAPLCPAPSPPPHCARRTDRGRRPRRGGRPLERSAQTGGTAPLDRARTTGRAGNRRWAARQAGPGNALAERHRPCGGHAVTRRRRRARRSERASEGAGAARICGALDRRDIHAAVTRQSRGGHAAVTRRSRAIRAGASVAAPPPVGAGPAPDSTSLTRHCDTPK